MNTQLLDGVVHKLPNDLKKDLLAQEDSSRAWNNLTPLARNEFICWVEEAKQDATRQKRITRTVMEIAEGRRRPCCWIGCIHRADKAISTSVAGILAKRAQKSKV